ncbi:uncharacterized protein BJ171DRAFT_426682, partial [Polychytrium aggregatum]|uniref:uncharacterized protein n=1 Tax=Polychytrium aggregatum TaxID=110093 RepID=UPI0022FE28AB
MSFQIPKVSPKWEFDGFEGGPSSHQIVLDWLLVPRNYERWAGLEKNASVSKVALCREIIRLLNDAKIFTRRESDVTNRINGWLKSYKEACAWLETEGATIRTSGVDDPESVIRFHILTTLKCKHFYEFHPIFEEA